MSIAKWLTTPWFWVPFLVCNLLFIWLVLSEQKHLKNGTRCSTCGSTKRKVRGKVRYFLSDYLFNDDLCDNEWHRRW